MVVSEKMERVWILEGFGSMFVIFLFQNALELLNL